MIKITPETHSVCSYCEEIVENTQFRKVNDTEMCIDCAIKILSHLCTVISVDKAYEHLMKENTANG